MKAMSAIGRCRTAALAGHVAGPMGRAYGIARCAIVQSLCVAYRCGPLMFAISSIRNCIDAHGFALLSEVLKSLIDVVARRISVRCRKQLEVYYMRLPFIWSVATMLCLTPARAQTSDDELARIALGRKLYESGVTLSGEPLVGDRSGVAVRGATAACVNCHRKSGFGTREGSIVVPSITGPNLFSNLTLPGYTARRAKSAMHIKSPSQSRPAYDDATLANAIRDGVSPTGHTFHPMMPRFSLDAANMASLVAYLRQLSSKPSDGVSSEFVDFATVIAPDQSSERRSAVVDVLQACMRERNEQRPNGPVWRLQIWDLIGLPSTWTGQLTHAYQRQTVFAIVSGIGDDQWDPVERFCEASGVPCLFANIDAPAGARPGQQSFYYTRGVALEADVFAEYLSGPARASIDRVVQISASSGVGSRASAMLRQQLASVNIAHVDRTIDPGDSKTLQIALADLNPRDALVLWLRPGPIASISKLPRPDVASVLASGWMAGFEAAPFSPQWKPGTVLTYPIDAPVRRAARMKFNLLPWLTRQGIQSNEELLLGNTLAACNLLKESLQRMRGAYHREYLVEQIENYPIGMGNAPASVAFPRFSLGPGQRYASTGAYLVTFKAPDSNVLDMIQDWRVPNTAR